MNQEVDVAVLGAGPAGVAAAIRLRRLGYSVLLVTGGGVRSRAIEGLSTRAHAHLQALELEHTVRSVQAQGTRGGTWAGTGIGVNIEYIIERAELDRALSLDAAANEVLRCEELAVTVEKAGALWRISTRSAKFLCRAVVDARGRRSSRPLMKGPSLIALSQPLRTQAGAAARTVILPVESGWCWFAATGQGAAVLQWITASARLQIERASLSRAVLDHMGRVQEYVRGCEHVTVAGSPIARAATARIQVPAPNEGHVRAGDAVVACDPLSGHGLYEALRSAGLAAAAVHTHLSDESPAVWEGIARFLLESSQELWATAMTAASAFYESQAVCTPTPFWVETAEAYATLRARPPQREACRVESRPVLNGSLIETRAVVVTAERPRGVWQVDTVELASLIDFLHHEPAAGIERAACQLDRQPAAVANALRWLKTHGLLERL